MRWSRRASSRDDRMDREIRDAYRAPGRRLCRSRHERAQGAEARPGGVRRAGAGQGTGPRRPAASVVQRARSRYSRRVSRSRREPLFALSVTIILTVAIGGRRGDVQRAAHGRPARALPYPRANELAMIRTRLHAGESAGRHVDSQLVRLAAREQDLRRDDVLSADGGEPGHLRRARRPAARTGRPGRPGLLRGHGNAADHRPHAVPPGLRSPRRVVVLSEGSGRNSSRDWPMRWASTGW